MLTLAYSIFIFMILKNSDKKELISLGLNLLLDKINEITLLIQDSQNAANSETKSSAGDKHETSRAHAHNETERLSKQLHNYNQSYRTLKGIVVSSCEHVKLGSYVKTDKGNFFITIGLGWVEVKNKKVFLISPQSPVGLAMANKKPGDLFQMPSGEEGKVIAVC